VVRQKISGLFLYIKKAPQSDLTPIKNQKLGTGSYLKNVKLIRPKKEKPPIAEPLRPSNKPVRPLFTRAIARFYRWRVRIGVSSSTSAYVQHWNYAPSTPSCGSRAGAPRLLRTRHRPRHRPSRRLHRVRLQTPLRLLPAATATATASARMAPLLRRSRYRSWFRYQMGGFPAGFAAGVTSVPSCIVM
jgi:hypothetical protein